MLGVLMLDTRFPRLRGDVGAAETFDDILPRGRAVRHRVVQGASAGRVVREADPALLQPFIDAGHALIAEGATALTTSCGFLARWQRELQAALPVPVWTSALLWLPELQRAHGVGHVGVITADARSFDAALLRGAGASPDTPFEGLPEGCAFQRCLLDDGAHFDPADARAATLAAAARLRERHPAVSTLVLECTNLPPYADALRADTGCTVHDLTTWLRARCAGPDRAQP